MSSKPTKNDRYKHDLQVALAMRGGEKKKQSIPPLSRRNDKKNDQNDVTSSQLPTALTNLDQAERLCKANRLEESLALYQYCIEILIGIVSVLKKKKQQDYSEVTYTQVTEITRAALHQAELVKEKLKKGKSTHKHLNKTTRPEYTKSQSEYKPKNHGYNNSQIMTSKSMEDNTLHHQNSKKSSQQKPLLNYKTNDPLIATIKSDIYVDSSTLTTTWEMISGLAVAKRSLQEAVILPFLRPDLYTELRSPPRGILLYGPPGTGKTMLVRAAAHESQCILFACSASSLTSKWVGEGEKLVRTLFKMATDVAPSIVFLDEIDSLLSKRREGGNGEAESSRRFKTEFMVQMEGVAGDGGGNQEHDLKKRMIVIGATNCPWDLDDAILRRFQRRISVPLPDTQARKALWENIITKANNSNHQSSSSSSSATSFFGKFQKQPTMASSNDIKQLVKMTQGYSASDISNIANDASFGPLRDLGGIEKIRDVNKMDVRPIGIQDFYDSIKSSKRSVSKELLDRYTLWENAQASS